MAVERLIRRTGNLVEDSIKGIALMDLAANLIIDVGSLAMVHTFTDCTKISNPPNPPAQTKIIRKRTKTSSVGDG